MTISKLSVLAAITTLVLLPLDRVAMAQVERTVYHPVHPSQLVECQEVDNALSRIPRGNGDGVITEDELGPGGWRYNRLGQSFITFDYTLNSAGTGYNVIAGRSNVGANTGIINDYPVALD